MAIDLSILASPIDWGLGNYLNPYFDGSYFQKETTDVDLSNLNPSFQARIDYVCQLYFIMYLETVNIEAGYLTQNQQSNYQEGIAIGFASLIVKHTQGIAIDIDGSQASVMDTTGLLEAAGLWRPMGERDAGHIEPIEARDPSYVWVRPTDPTIVPDSTIPTQPPIYSSVSQPFNGISGAISAVAGLAGIGSKLPSLAGLTNLAGIGGALGNVMNSPMGKAISSALTGNIPGAISSAFKGLTGAANPLTGAGAAGLNNSLANAGPQDGSQKNDIKGSAGALQQTQTVTATTVLPTHEPWIGHPKAKKPPRQAVSGGSSGSGSGAGTGNSGSSSTNTPTSSNPGVSTGTSAPAKGPVSDRAQRLMDRLVQQHGWTPVAAAIAAGNAEQESSVRSDGPLGDTGRFGTGVNAAHGMFQWRADRFRALDAFAQARGTNWQDFDTQVDFFAQETQKRSALERRWKNATDFSEAGAFGKKFEGYGDNSTDARVKNAQKWIATYNANKNNGTNPSNVSTNAPGNKPSTTASNLNTDSSSKQGLPDRGDPGKAQASPANATDGSNSKAPYGGGNIGQVSGPASSSPSSSSPSSTNSDSASFGNSDGSSGTSSGQTSNENGGGVSTNPSENNNGSDKPSPNGGMGNSTTGTEAGALVVDVKPHKK